MLIKPSIRSNVFLNAHPLGCKEFVHRQIEEAKHLPTFKGPQNVLLIGGSSGYGFATRVALAYGAGSNTINVSYEVAPKEGRTGTAGWWNNIFFQNYAKETTHTHKDFIGDAFSKQMKLNVVDYLKKQDMQIDLVVYSLASGARMNEDTHELVRSTIKPLGQDLIGKTIDVATMTLKELAITAGNEQETKDTIFVMGGSDWYEWIDILHQEGVLNHSCKTISYTYIGGQTTDSIYRGGTLGHAKDDLEKTATRLNTLLSTHYQGEALISSSKAVVTKASVFIPSMPIYVSAMLEVMMAHQVHETILSHKHRLYRDMVYGPNRLTDALGRLRLDHFELQPVIQQEIKEKMILAEDVSFLTRPGTQIFVEEFYQIHGFGFPTINYEEDVDLDQLSALQPV